MKTIWSFDLGKGSIGEAVREVNKATFLHKASLLIPVDLAQRGPSWKSGTPASKHRALKTREAHWKREAWLDELWRAARLIPLARRAVAPTGGEWHAYSKRIRGKEKIKTRHTNAKWKLVQEGDARLEKEFAATGDETCFTSCLLRIKLLNPKTLTADETLAEWQIYKSLFSAMQKRGYGDVPWKEQRKGGAGETKDQQEQAEDALAGKRWLDFVAELEKAELGDDYRRACYFDAYYMKLWSPSTPDVVALHPTDRPQSTRKVVFPASVIEAEVLALAQNAAVLLKDLESAYATQMKKYRDSVEERIARANAHRAQRGKKLVTLPDFSRGAKDFAELLVYGPGGKPALANGVRPIASADPAIRRATGLRPGSPDDRMGVMSQGTARFDNRLRSDCALIPRLSCCRNLRADEFAKITDDNDPRLLPAHVTFLMKLKDLWVQEFDETRTQRKLNVKNIIEIFAEQNKARKYSLTPSEWKTWCKRFSVMSVVVPKSKAKDTDRAEATGEKTDNKKTKYIIDPPATSGRSRFSRPALRILKGLVLSGNTPSVFRDRLVKSEALLLDDLGLDVLEKAQLTTQRDERGKEFTNFAKRPRPWVLVSDLDGLQNIRRVERDGTIHECWEDIHIPSQQLDVLAQRSSATRQERNAAIRALIGQQSNPIIRHRLDTFWERLRVLEAMPGTEGKPLGEPHRIVIEMVRDDSESSWLGPMAVKEITKAQKNQRDRRDNARKRLLEMDQPHGDLLRYLLWEEQGAQCFYTGDALPFTSLGRCRIDHIVPRALGGPDSNSNRILTTDSTNARKGDRTPYRWLHSTPEWDAYCRRVDDPKNKLGEMKKRLLLSADAETLVSRYTPLAETAWIARLAQTVASLHFGWANGNDASGTKRVVVISGGLTGRVRRKYFLNSLLGSDRRLDENIAIVLDEIASLRTSPLPRQHVREKLRELRDELGELGRQAEKNRSDKRHHALDAMVLSFLEGWVNEPRREDEFRFTALGDAPAFPEGRNAEIGSLRQRIVALRAAAADKVKTSEQREELQRQITVCHDAIASMRQPHDTRTVREALRREIVGDIAAGILPVLPRPLNFTKQHPDASKYRGVWLHEEDESATEEAKRPVWKTTRTPLAGLAYATNWQTREKEFSTIHLRRMMAQIVANDGYDADALRFLLRAFVETNPPPTEEQWRNLTRAPETRALWTARGKAGEEMKLLHYSLVEKRTKRPQLTPSDRASLYSLAVGGKLVKVFDSESYETKARRLVLLPSKNASPVALKLEPDLMLQEKLLRLLPKIKAHYRVFRPNPPKRLRQPAEKAAWEAQKKTAEAALVETLEEENLKPDQRVWFATYEDDVTDLWKKGSLRTVLLADVPEFTADSAIENVKYISDIWTRFQVREFLKQSPSTDEWKEYCAELIQVPRASFQEFLAGQPTKAQEFIEFYRREDNQQSKSGRVPVAIKAVHCMENDPPFFFDISKDGSGIFATGRNHGYWIWSHRAASDKEIVYGAEVVRIFESPHFVKRRILDQGKEVLDTTLWRGDILLELPKDCVNEDSKEKKTIQSGYYFLGSISTQGKNQYAELKEMADGTNTGKFPMRLLLRDGLRRVNQV